MFAFNRGDGVGGNYPPGVNVTDLGLVPNGKGYVGKFFRATSKLKKYSIYIGMKTVCILRVLLI